jgi:hypothetical protein
VSEPEELWQKCPFTKAELDKMRRETQQRAIGELADAVADNRAILEEILRRVRQTGTLQHCLDAIVWEWDNPYADPGDWVPLEE